ncbi:hypothetical protein C8F04DRAFT_1181346 [Mycena alexandri]|uniref:Uncharacterized protein n=1 Tax=Mycena alexandri TaxID=1745969 RepID=A0AAD6T1A1_9AGAR|nr:hypothetical protein C8F04DRAFT_1181346 [Mycena alexandri]
MASASPPPDDSDDDELSRSWTTAPQFVPLALLTRDHPPMTLDRPMTEKNPLKHVTRPRNVKLHPKDKNAAPPSQQKNIFRKNYIKDPSTGFWDTVDRNLVKIRKKAGGDAGKISRAFRHILKRDREYHGVDRGGQHYQYLNTEWQLIFSVHKMAVMSKTMYKKDGYSGEAQLGVQLAATPKWLHCGPIRNSAGIQLSAACVQLTRACIHQNISSWILSGVEATEKTCSIGTRLLYSVLQNMCDIVGRLSDSDCLCPMWLKIRSLLLPTLGIVRVEKYATDTTFKVWQLPVNIAERRKTFSVNVGMRPLSFLSLIEKCAGSLFDSGAGHIQRL